jgi:hypothetical protein
MGRNRFEEFVVGPGYAGLDLGLGRSIASLGASTMGDPQLDFPLFLGTIKAFCCRSSERLKIVSARVLAVPAAVGSQFATRADRRAPIAHAADERQELARLFSQ